MSLDNSVDIKDFTLPNNRIRFRITPDVFEAYAALGAHTLQSMVKTSKKFADMLKANDYEPVLDLFDQVLVPESAARFRERFLSTDGDETLDIQRQVIPALNFLMEEYGLRPTQQSSD